MTEKYEHYLQHKNFGRGRTTAADVKRETTEDGKKLKLIMSLVSVGESIF